MLPQDLTVPNDHCAPEWEEFKEQQPTLPREEFNFVYREMMKVIAKDGSWVGREWPTIPQSRMATGLSLLGNVKQKDLDWRWQVTGVHQLILWIDDRRGQRDRQGARAMQRCSQRKSSQRWQRFRWSRRNQMKTIKAECLEAKEQGRLLLIE